MIVVLRRFLKLSGIACFTHISNTNLENVQRFNYYYGQAVFLLDTSEVSELEISSLFDLDLVQNVVFFDSLGDPYSDLQNLISKCRLPLSMKVSVYRIISKDSYEDRVYQIAKRNQTVN